MRLRKRTILNWMKAYGWEGETAVKEYQEFHGLSPDGEIGDITERHVLLPRICNHPDRMEVGSSRRKFPTNEVTVGLLDNFPGFNRSQSMEILNYCLEQWEQVSGLKLFIKGGNSAMVRIQTGNIDGPMGTLAWSNLAPQNPCMQKYDDAESWVYVNNHDPNSQIPRGRIDIAAVCMHELAHAFGIPHGGQGLMMPTYNPRVRKPQPGFDEKEIQLRYGKPTGTTPEPPKPKPPGYNPGKIEKCLRSCLDNRETMDGIERLFAGRNKTK